MNILKQATFLLGAHELSQLPSDQGCEVAFAGRSNSGKSSALNTITGLKKLARTSKTPGRTQQINLFELGEQRFLVDLPGYGYAKVPEKIRKHWQVTIGQYLETRQSLRGLFIIMDIRHPLKPFDEQLLSWCTHYEMAAHILLTKADKLSKGAAASTLQKVTNQIQGDYDNPNITLQTFSALTRIGVDGARKHLLHWLADKPKRN